MEVREPQRMLIFAKLAALKAIDESIKSSDMQFKNIEIKNFRGIKSLNVEDFGRINLFLGKNNCGKTSVLEAVFALVGSSNPEVFEIINALRGQKTFNPEYFKYLFHDLNYNNKPSVGGTIDYSGLSIVRSFELSARERKYHSTSREEKPKGSTIHQSELFSGDSELMIEGFDLRASESRSGGDFLTFQGSIDIEEEEIKYRKASDFQEYLNAFFVTHKADYEDIKFYLSRIIKKKKEFRLVNALKAVDERIEGIQLLHDGVYFDLKELDELMPLSMMGDGIRHFLNIFAPALILERVIILIDEIDFGLHFSAHRALWKALLGAMKQTDIQLFITTHNIETLRSLEELLKEEYQDMQKDVRAYSIVKNQKGETRAFKYDYEKFEHAIEFENEIR
jgi:AAA15 family ATPase/GTPase